MAHRRVRHLPFSAKSLGASLALFSPALAGYADGDPVGTWNDISGNGDDATGALTAPLYAANAQGGMPAVHFDAALTNTIQAGSTSISASAAFIVCINIDTTSYGAVLRIGTSTNTVGLYFGPSDTYYNAENYFTNHYQDGVSLGSSCGSGTTYAWKVYAMTGTVNSPGIVAIGGNGAGGLANQLGGNIGTIILLPFEPSDSLRSRLSQSLGFTFRIAQIGS